MSAIVAARRPLTPLEFLALGTFAIGTERFMIAPVLTALGGAAGPDRKVCPQTA